MESFVAQRIYFDEWFERAHQNHISLILFAAIETLNFYWVRYPKSEIYDESRWSGSRWCSEHFFVSTAWSDRIIWPRLQFLSKLKIDRITLIRSDQRMLRRLFFDLLGSTELSPNHLVYHPVNHFFWRVRFWKSSSPLNRLISRFRGLPARTRHCQRQGAVSLKIK